MSEQLYTCDYCVEAGHDEVACHRPSELSVYNGKTVCDGCIECGDFHEFDDENIQLDVFITPDQQHITTLEQRIAELQAAQQWVSVSERLPESDDDVWWWDAHHLDSIEGVGSDRSRSDIYKIRYTHWHPRKPPAPPAAQGEQ